MKNSGYRQRFTRIVTGVALLGAFMSGCTLGPDFKTPTDTVSGGYTAKPSNMVIAATAGDGQRLVSGGELPAQWWEVFHDRELDALIRRALADSPTLAAAEATLRQAEENLRAQKGVVYFPALDAKLSGSRQRVSMAASGQPGTGAFTYGLYNASLAVSYNLDLFGTGRRELEALRADVDFQRYQREAAHLTLTSNIVTSAVREASLRAQLDATREILAAQEQLLRLVERQFELGGATRSDVLAQRTQLAQTRVTLPQLEKELVQTRNQLAVYSGKAPAEASLPEFTLDSLRLPKELPLSLPSALTRQRPDIRASEELLHAACARVGVATANLFPQVTLSADVGAQAATLGKLFSNGTPIWSLGAGLLQPVFRGGELTAKRRAAIAAYDQAAAQYRDVVLRAFASVADVLQALESDAAALAAQAETEKSARETLELTQRQYEIGATGYPQLLNAQRQHQQTRIGLVQARAARLADSAALFQALGGGWWNRPSEAVAGK